MANVSFNPPFIDPAQLIGQMRTQGSAVLAPHAVAQWLGVTLNDLHAMDRDWASLPPDEHLKDGGRYRRRRHACFTVQGAQLEQVPHRAHWQPVEYNALHGGMERWFAPMEPATIELAVWQRLLLALAQLSDAVFGNPASPQTWFIEAHQFRIDTNDGIGRPTPEGAHRDGVDLVAVFLVDRAGIKGGETRVFEANGPHGQRFTLTQPWSLMLLDDARMIHETTPIQPLTPGGYRDTLVVTCRRRGFQGAGGAA